MDNNQVWALLVGVAEYPHWKDPATGAINDVECQYKYLTRDLKVPPQNIEVLIGPQATRAAIISTFRRHLIDNPSIQKGAPILFHFSGHGVRCKAPEGWPVIEEEGEGKKGNLEVIIPYDATDPKEDEPPVCGIPDRTIAALLEMAAREHGENITVTLDCCHSSHCTRGQDIEESEPAVYSSFDVRTIASDAISPLSEGVDEEIWGPIEKSEERAGRPRAGFASREAKSHVLLAACDKNELAVGWNTNPTGGLLTTYWLKALRDKVIQPRTYTQLMKAVEEEIAQLRAQYPTDVTQHPQCVGITRDRLVFQNSTLGAQYFLLLPGDGKECRIQAGEAQGVKKGTIFELCEVDPDTMKSGATIGKAVATSAELVRCLAEVPEDVKFGGPCYAARIVGHPLKYAISCEDRSPNASDVLNKITTKLQEMDPEIADYVQFTTNENNADVVLVVSGEGEGEVRLKRQDEVLKHLEATPRLDREDLERVNFSELFDAIARFNFYLAQSSELRPFAADVDVELHLLEPDLDLDFLSDSCLEKARATKGRVSEEGNVLEITQNDEDDYAFIIRNRGDKRLFVYIVYFDPGTYEISAWYCPTNPDQATLLPHGELQVGASPEHVDSFRFFVRKGDEVDTSFLKIFLLDEAGKMSFMDQKAQVGCDDEGNKYLRADVDDEDDEDSQMLLGPEVLVKGGWDCVTRMIRVKRKETTT